MLNTTNQETFDFFIELTPFESGRHSYRGGVSPMNCPYETKAEREKWLQGWDEESKRDAGLIQ